MTCVPSPWVHSSVSRAFVGMLVSKFLSGLSRKISTSDVATPLLSRHGRRCRGTRSLRGGRLQLLGPANLHSPVMDQNRSTSIASRFVCCYQVPQHLLSKQQMRIVEGVAKLGRAACNRGDLRRRQTPLPSRYIRAYITGRDAGEFEMNVRVIGTARAAEFRMS